MEDGKSESSDKQTFYNEFFNVFGITRKRVASFEEPIKKLGNKQGFIDLFWKGVLLVEHKSFGKSLIKAKEQAFEYFPNIKENELPKYILVSDFNNFELYDLEENKEYVFKLEELYKNIEILSFIAGYTKKVYKDQTPVSIEASKLMVKLYEELEKSNYKEHDLELFLVRILFCLFADDTGIFSKDDFKYFIIENTKEDGSDTGALLSQLFEILDTPEEERQNTLDEALNNFPYINGLLFNSAVRIPSFNSLMRRALLDCYNFDWGQISPAIFGSLFQYVANEKIRREFGEHYTTEKNIMKTISPLFLDELRNEFERIKKNISKLKEFQIKLSKLKFLDPACGCGNFLILAYKEMRKLEIEVLKIIHNNIENEGIFLDASTLSIIDVDNFYGIEINEFPAKIAEVAMWLMDHQMNMLLSENFGQLIQRIPLKKSATIKNTNALTLDWNNVINKSDASFILGNPPFVGARMKSSEQSKEMAHIFSDVKKGAMDLDYVCAWYKKASEFIQGTKIKVGFVSTNSITQGTQVGVLWNHLMGKYNIKIHFAHKTFEWDSEASGKAHVHCVIIGFACFDIPVKRLFDYDDIKGEAHEIVAKNINPYLISFKDLFIISQSKPICYNVPQIVLGNMANDNGNFLFTKEEKDDFIQNEPNAKKFIKRFAGAEEYINNKERYCLWL